MLASYKAEDTSRHSLVPLARSLWRFVSTFTLAPLLVSTSSFRFLEAFNRVVRSANRCLGGALNFLSTKVGQVLLCMFALLHWGRRYLSLGMGLMLRKCLVDGDTLELSLTFGFLFLNMLVVGEVLEILRVYIRLLGLRLR